MSRETALTMLKGRVVRIREHDGESASVLRVFFVGIEHADTAVNAVLAAYPEFEGFPVEADERLSSTAIAFLDMREGEIRDRVTEAQVNLIGSHGLDG